MIGIETASLRLCDVLQGVESENNENFVARVTSTVTDQMYLEAQTRSQRHWFAAIAALEQLLTQYQDLTSAAEQGLILSGPIPVFSHPELLPRFYSGIFTSQAWQNFLPLPGKNMGKSSANCSPCSPRQEFPLFSQDPLTTEQFCLVLTANFGLLLVLTEDEKGLPLFDFSFEPERLEKAWLTLRSRLNLVHVSQLQKLEELVQKFAPTEPSYRLVNEFSRQLLKYLPNFSTESPSHSVNINLPTKSLHNEALPSPDVELLQALTHEIRTPLTTIRTLVRLLLRKKDLATDVRQKIQTIDQECTAQIDRMELIFRATELESLEKMNQAVPLVSTSLEQVFESSIPRWQQQAKRYNIVLEVDLPAKFPPVFSNPAMLDQILTGLIEKFVRSLASGGAIRLQVSTAGHQLKVQFHTQSSYQINPLKALGELLMFQPETGCLSLNLEVTKNLFQALGGKLTVRQRSQQEEVLTIYLPLLKS